MATLKPSEKISLYAIAASTIGVGLVYWFIPGMPWWVYLLLWLFAAGVWANQWTRHAANKKIADED